MAYNKTKIDSKLGAEIQAHLESLGLHTPVVKENLAVDNFSKIEQIEAHMAEILKIIGVDLQDDSMIETPKRMAKMFVLEDFWGLDPDNFPKNTCIENKMKADEMVKVGNIKVISRCEHHWEKILGYAHIAYIPGDKVIGLSKLGRVVEYFARRPQVQERLTEQVFHALCYMLGTDNVAVHIEATHLCMTTRGVEHSDAYTSTSKLGGTFKTDTSARAEFFSLKRQVNH